MSTFIITHQFQAEQVRVLEIDGEPWFVASDVARILGYRDAANLCRRLDDDDRGTRSVSTPGGEQRMTVVSEPGLYAAVLGSQVPGARDFKRWVTHEVLPQIRRTGQYGAPVRELSGPELMARALIEADSTIKAQAAELEAARPKVEVADRLLDATTDLSVRDAANALTRAGFRIGQNRLFALLHEIGWAYRGRDGSWRPDNVALTAGRLSVLPMSHYHPRTGELVLDPPQLRVTPKGLALLLREHGPRQQAIAEVVA